MEEPSVLDYVKALLSFGRVPRIEIPSAVSASGATENETPAAETATAREETPSQAFIAPAAVAVEAPVAQAEATAEPAAARPAAAAITLPWRSLASVVLALVAQTMLDPNTESAALPAILYAVSASTLVWGILRGEWTIAPLREEASEPMSLALRAAPLYILLPAMLIAFLAFGGNRFNSLNLLLWALCFVLLFLALWLPRQEPNAVPLRKRIADALRSPAPANVRITWFGVLLVLIGLTAVFFRFYQLDQVPGQMFSDHAEKLLDVQDVLDGQTAIFFIRNTGREAFQMYLTAFAAKVLGFGISFMSLKVGTALAGLFTLPFIYLLGKEVGGRWVGLFALALASFAYWPNVISRVGLRFPLYPLFVAPMLFYLVRGLRTQNRNDFILAGLALGLGLHGYSPIRIVPFIVVIAFGLYMLHAQSRGKRAAAFWALVALAFVSFIVFLPLFRYSLTDPEMFGYRAFSRLGTTEQPLPGPALLIFLSNLWKASIMFFRDNGEIWVHSIPGRPALDVISAAFLFLGGISLFVRYLRRRHWLDLFLLISVPLFMLPSILSLAFPGENPSLNRTGAAYIPVFVIAAIGLEAFLSALISRARTIDGRVLVGLVALLLVALSVTQNYDLVFRQYKNQFLAGAWNTSDLGRIIRQFTDSVGSPDSAYVVPYPHWVDTRLVGINAGYPRKDFALWAADFPTTLDKPNPKLFLLKPDDQDSLAQLRQIYPTGILRVYHVDQFEGKDFLMYFVPPDEEGAPPPEE